MEEGQRLGLRTFQLEQCKMNEKENYAEKMAAHVQRQSHRRFLFLRTSVSEHQTEETLKEVIEHRYY
jgi:hypothetical protein